MTVRFKDDQTQLSELTDDVLVECPRCGRCALVRRRAPDEDRTGYTVVLTCVGCGHAAVRPTNWMALGGPVDPYLGLPLWLQTRCGGETLWAYNARHLDRLEAYVGAKLRARSRDPQYGWSNKSLASRLPTWIRAARNREAVLASIAELRASRLLEAPT